jgi:phosphatidylethanolamine/phosphatidyl-N-methylethanolamine N-methyltransferase
MDKLERLGQYIKLDDPMLLYFVACCIFNPVYWNVLARLEYNYKLLTSVFGCGNNYRGCYVLALTIFSLGVFRDYL